MPGINIDFDEADYSTIRGVAAGSGLPIKTFARLAILSATVPASAQWALVTTTAVDIPQLSYIATDMMRDRRGQNSDEGWRNDACLWTHLTERALIVAYPYDHGDKEGRYEFLLDTKAASFHLADWDDLTLHWSSSTRGGQHAACNAAVLLANRRLGITSSPAFAAIT